MADTRSLIMTAGAAVGAVVLLIGGIAAAGALDVDDAPGEVTATAGIGTDSTVADAPVAGTDAPVAADPTATPTESPDPTVEPAPAPAPVEAQPVVQPAPVEVHADPVGREKTRTWDDGDATNDSWWCDDRGSWHWGDRTPADPVAAPADPTAGDPGWGDGSGDRDWGDGSGDRDTSGDEGGWNDGDRGWDGGGGGGSGWGGGGSGGGWGH